MHIQGLLYLVRFVVILRVVLEHLGLFLVVKGGYEGIDTAAKLFAPFLAIDKPARDKRLATCSVLHLVLPAVCNLHLLGQIDVKLARSQESQLEVVHQQLRGWSPLQRVVVLLYLPLSACLGDRCSRPAPA